MQKDITIRKYNTLGGTDEMYDIHVAGDVKTFPSKVNGRFFENGSPLQFFLDGEAKAISWPADEDKLPFGVGDTIEDALEDFNDKHADAEIISVSAEVAVTRTFTKTFKMSRKDFDAAAEADYDDAIKMFPGIMDVEPVESDFEVTVCEAD